MREVLFRGKSQALRQWFEGDLVHCENNRVCISTVAGSFVSIKPETVGQYTGLTDKNGKKIFEGDIVEYEHELSGFLRFELGEDYKPRRSHSCHWDDKHYLHYKRNYAVEWKEKDARWILRNGSDQHDLRRISLSMHNGIVIGNIHDNLELLKGSVSDA